MSTSAVGPRPAIPAPAPAPARRGPAPAAVLVVVLVASFAINLDSTVVNVALPSLNRELGAGTSALQWVVDGYNLAFAALVLAGGNLGDRLGRRGVLAGGLGLFVLGTLASAFSPSVGVLIATRVVSGMGAALIFPTTLSIITATFPDRRQRAAAIGAWGGVTGLGVAVGPLAGGALLDHFWWGSVFVALVPVAVIALIGTLAIVPSSRAADRPPLDRTGLALSVVALGALVYTVIGAPSAGWASARSLAGFAVAAVAFTAFARVERRHRTPMLDVTLFTNLRFSAASGAVTVAFFALFGFIFLITQYFQQLRSYAPLSTGVHLLPVAASIAVASVLGTRAAVRFGTKAVVATGLVLLATAFAWVSQAGAHLPYADIAGQMVLIGGGLGLTTAPATESIMGVVRPEQAGAGSAVNDATREVGGTLGVAVLGSVYASLYTSHLHHSAAAHLPAAALRTATTSFGAGQAVAAHVTEAAHAAVAQAVVSGFLSGLHAACLVAAGTCLLGALAVAALLPSRPGAPTA
jgi:EmrB/QacA subfamily drug resistance transporter